MSVEANTKLLERAAELIDYWTGTQWADRIEAAIDSQDFEELESICKKAHYEMLSVEQTGEADV